MIQFPAQFGPLAQGSGFDDWANILFLLVVAVLWLFGALVKALSRKTPPQTPAQAEGAAQGQRPPGETWQERLVRRAEELQRRLEEEAGLGEPESQRPPARQPAPRPTQASGGRVTVRTDLRGESIMVYEPPQTPASVPREPPVARPRERRRTVTAGGRASTLPKVELTRRETSGPAIQGLPSIMAEPTKALEPEKVQLPAQQEPEGYEPGAVIDYSDPEALKKAILHYEILGKPLALRDTSDETATF